MDDVLNAGPTAPHPAPDGGPVESVFLPEANLCVQRALTVGQLAFLLEGNMAAVAAVRGRYPAAATRIPTADVGELLSDWHDRFGGARIPGIDCVVPDWTAVLADRLVALRTAVYARRTPELAAVIDDLRRAYGVSDLHGAEAHRVLGRALERHPAYAAHAPVAAQWRAEVLRATEEFADACRRAVTEAPPLPPPRYRVVGA